MPSLRITAPGARVIMDILNREGDMARFVGGCVRDTILGRPIADIDIATRHRPGQVTARLRDAGIRVVPTGPEHGTVTAIINRQPFEITTLRRDVETDGRRAVVAFTENWHTDAARRDFTMNAIFLRPDGTLDDPFGGHDDAMAGRVRFVGDADIRIREDVLRILRFFRFHAHYGKGDGDADGLAACRAHAALIDTLSGERIGSEFLKLLAAPFPARVLEVMEKAGILPVFLPGPYNPGILTRLLDAARERVPDAAPDPILRLAAFAPEHDGQPFRACTRMRFSNAGAKRLQALSHTQLPPLGEGSAARQEIHRHGNALFADLVQLKAARGRLPQGRAASLLALSAAWPKPELPVRGADLLQTGLAPGPAVGNILRRLESWWIAADFTPDRAACLTEAQRMIAGELSPGGETTE